MFFKIFRVQTVLNIFQEMISLDGKKTYILSILVLAYEIIYFIYIIACLWHGWAYYDDNNETWIVLLNEGGRNGLQGIILGFDKIIKMVNFYFFSFITVFLYFFRYISQKFSFILIANSFPVQN